jgi:hypothetical protein
MNSQSGERLAPVETGDQAGVENCLGGSRLPCGDIARRCERNGRCIRHAPLRTAFPIGALTIAMIETALGAVLVATIGAPSLLTKGWKTTAGTAITLAAITGATDAENRVASTARSLPKNNLALIRHPGRQVGLDKDDSSWQG